MKKIIEYKQIPDYCDRVDKNKMSTIILNKFQASLFEKMTKDNVRPRWGLHHFFELVSFCCCLICVLLFARYLLLLEHFYCHNQFNGELIKFTKLSNGKVMVIFNKNAAPNFDLD